MLISLSTLLTKIAFMQLMCLTVIDSNISIYVGTLFSVYDLCYTDRNIL